MTITEKILARGAGLKQVSPGELITVKLDFILANDITAPPAIAAFRNAGAKQVYNRERIALVPDHFTPNKDIRSAQQVKEMRLFAKEFGLRYFFEIGQAGIEHALLPEAGLVLPGEIIIGADSHTCTYGALGAFATGVGSTDLAAAMITGETWLKVPPTIRVRYDGRLPQWVGGKDLILHLIGQIGVDGALYRALEFCGEAVEALSMENRLTMANMVIEAGAKNGLFEVDGKTMQYVRERAKRSYKIIEADDDADYEKELHYDVSTLEPLVACPHLPSNVMPAGSLKDVKVDQVVLGSCTNGRIEDLRVAASLLDGEQIAPGVRMIVLPATRDIYLQALKEGVLESLVRAGAVVSTPTCGPCLGGHMGVLADGEVALATTNRNFQGRMGHSGSEIYLAGPAVAAATALKGVITSPAAL